MKFAGQREHAFHWHFFQIGIGSPFVFRAETPVIEIETAFKVGLHGAVTHVAAGHREFRRTVGKFALERIHPHFAVGNALSANVSGKSGAADWASHAAVPDCGAANVGHDSLRSTAREIFNGFDEAV